MHRPGPSSADARVHPQHIPHVRHPSTPNIVWRSQPLPDTAGLLPTNYRVYAFFGIVIVFLFFFLLHVSARGRAAQGGDSFAKISSGATTTNTADGGDVSGGGSGEDKFGSAGGQKSRRTGRPPPQPVPIKHAPGLEPPPPPPLPNASRTVWFVRVGLAEHEGAPGDRGIRDAKLSAKGDQQVKEFFQAFNESGIDTIVTSPLRRALQTTQHLMQQSPAFGTAYLGGRKSPHIVVLPDLQEASDAPCDTGSPVGELKSQFPGFRAALEGMEARMASVNRGRLRNSDWFVKLHLNAPHDAAVRQRAKNVVAFLATLPVGSGTTVVVGHTSVFAWMLGDLWRERPGDLHHGVLAKKLRFAHNEFKEIFD